MFINLILLFKVLYQNTSYIRPYYSLLLNPIGNHLGLSSKHGKARVVPDCC